MKTCSNLLILLVLTAGLFACGRASQINIPKPTVQQVPGASALVEQIPMADRSTFQGATFEYMSDNLSNVFHKVPIGDYLLANFLAALPDGVSVASMQLQKFSGKCVASGLMQPKAMCDVAVVVLVKTGEASNIVSLRISESPGPWISSFGSNYAKMTTAGEGEKVVTQIKLLLRSAAKTFAKELQARTS